MITRTTLVLLAAAVLTGCQSPPSQTADSPPDATPDFATTGAIIPVAQLYSCGMHPHVISEEPGDCPICGMRLTPINPTSGGGDVIEIDPGTVQTIGVRTATVQVAALTRQIRTTGRFEMDEQGAHTVSLKTAGWIERLYVDFTGAIVRRGQSMLEMYSPQLVTTQEELLLAMAHRDRLGTDSPPSAIADADRLIEAARRRLAYFDVSEEQIAEIERTRTVSRTVRYLVPASGEVMEKMVVEGEHVTAGQPLLRIFDTSRIWIIADVYEQDLPWVTVGTAATISAPYTPDRSYSGRVGHMYYMMDQETRSARARITLEHRDPMLRPGMYAVVELDAQPTAAGPVVPEEAVLWTGSRTLVILSVGSGRFRPVPIEVGVQAEGLVQVTGGLQGGEEIVISAQFLIDSEARLKTAIGAMIGSHDHGDGDAMIVTGNRDESSSGGMTMPAGAAMDMPGMTMPAGAAMDMPGMDMSPTAAPDTVGGSSGAPPPDKPKTTNSTAVHDHDHLEMD